MQRFLFNITALALVFLSSTSLAQDNRVLELDGDGSYVELPPNIFNVLEEATVEFSALHPGLSPTILLWSALARPNPRNRKWNKS